MAFIIQLLDFKPDKGAKTRLLIVGPCIYEKCTSSASLTDKIAFPVVDLYKT